MVLDGKAGRSGVSAVSHQQIGTLIQGFGDVKLGDAASRPFGRFRALLWLPALLAAVLAAALILRSCGP